MSDQQPDVSAPDVSSTDASPTPDAGPDMSALMARMDELAASVSSLSPKQDAEDDFQSLSDLALGDYGYEDDEQPAPGDDYDQAQAVQQFIADQVQQGVRSQLDPFFIAQGAQRLEQQYPDLQKPEVAGPVVKQAEQMAARMGQQMGMSREQVHRLSRDPSFIETTYLAFKARSMAAQETPVGGDHAHIEGSSAQVEQPEVSRAQRILEAGGNSPSGFQWF